MFGDLLDLKLSDCHEGLPRCPYIHSRGHSAECYLLALNRLLRTVGEGHDPNDAGQQVKDGQTDEDNELDAGNRVETVSRRISDHR